MKRFGLILLLTWCSLYADTRFYDEVGLGEADLAHYSGPLDPSINHKKSSGALEFADDLFSTNYLAPVTSQAIFEWKETWFDDFPGQSVCPNSYMAENIDYIRYLYRLLTLSYIYESLKDYQETLYGLGQSSQGCSLSYDVLFSKCRPKADEMKKFIARAKSIMVKDLKNRPLVRFDSRAKNNWIARVRNTRDDLTPAQGRVRGWCEDNNMSCDTLNEKQIISALTNACNQEKQLFANICSEKDHLHGLSRIPEIIPVLASSHVLKVINNGGHGEACLVRYARLLSFKERWHPPLQWIMPAVKSKLSFLDARYPQGTLFVAGALREFDERGLGDFIFVEPTPEATAVPTPVVAALPTPVPTPIMIPRPQEKVPIAVATAAPTPTPKPLSAFEYAVKIHLNGRDPIDVDMKRFSSEGRFSAKVIESLSAPLKQYQTRVALQDMKKNDKLGTFNEPVRLMFLKFLIDEDQHQGLWNIVNVLGEGFYVINDLEGRKDPLWVRLRNDRSTSYTWQLTLEVEPTK